MLTRQPCNSSSVHDVCSHHPPPIQKTMASLKPPDPSISSRGIVVFSGGSAANSLVDVFNEIATKRKASLSYIIPISDNGGSSSELIRVFGGPGIGDIRSSYPLASFCMGRSTANKFQVASCVSSQAINPQSPLS